MSSIPVDVINKLGTAQLQIWQAVSGATSEAAGHALTFATPLTISAKTSELYAEIGSPMLVIQFSFASMPESAQVIVIPQETVAGIASIIGDDEVTDIDENVVSDLRPTMEAIVQGICSAVGNVKNETVGATGLTIRYQILSLPPNLQKTDELVRTQVAITGEGVNGTAMWLMDSETGHEILDMTMLDENDEPFQQVASSTDLGSGRMQGGDDSNALDLLMDIPLEISVELGRVKMLVRDVVELGTGSIVEIDKAAGEPVDVMVNGKLVARGEVVVIEDNFGVRITEIINPQERLHRLNEAA